MAEVNRKQVETDWKQRGFNGGEMVDPPGQRWDDFTHAVDEVIMLLEGEIEVEVDGKVSHPPVGEELYVPAGAVHSVRNIGNTPAKWIYGYKRS